MLSQIQMFDTKLGFIFGTRLQLSSTQWGSKSLFVCNCQMRWLTITLLLGALYLLSFDWFSTIPSIAQKRRTALLNNILLSQLTNHDNMGGGQFDYIFCVSLYEVCSKCIRTEVAFKMTEINNKRKRTFCI